MAVTCGNAEFDYAKVRERRESTCGYTDGVDDINTAGVRASTGTVPHSVESMADDAYAFITEEREDASGSAVVRLGVAGRDVVDVDTA